MVKAQMLLVMLNTLFPRLEHFHSICKVCIVIDRAHSIEIGQEHTGMHDVKHIVSNWSALISATLGHACGSSLSNGPANGLLGPPKYTHLLINSYNLFINSE